MTVTRPLSPALERLACSFPECPGRAHSKGLCQGHYRQYWLGKALAPLSPRWKTAEIDYLRRAYEAQVIDLHAIAKKMGRSHASVALKASRLGLGDFGRPKMTQVDLPLLNPPDAKNLAVRRSVAAATRIKTHGHPRGMLGKTHTGETKAVLAAASRAQWADPLSKNNSPASRQRRSDQLVARLKAGQMRPKYSRCRGGKRADLDGRYFRSSWEANYARYLNWLKKSGKVASWEFEPKTFIFEAIQRGTRAYTPDFRVVLPDGQVEWHEVKGWMDDKSKTRLARMAKYYPEEKIVLRDSKFFRWLNGSVLPKVIPNWETGREVRP